MRAAGFSLVELLIALMVAGLVLAATVTILHQGQHGYRLGAAQLDAQQSARVALERMVREIQNAGLDPRGAGFPAIANSAPARFTIQSDLNGSGAIDANGEAVTYLLRGTTLRRNAGGGAQPVIEGVRALAFTYLDADGRPTAIPAEIRTVGIELAAQASPTPGVPLSDAPVVTMRTQVRLRNR